MIDRNSKCANRSIPDDEDDNEEEANESEEEHFYPKPPQLAYREFFNLILTCLKGHDEQKDVLLTSLHKQLVHFVRATQDVSTIFNISFAHAHTKQLSTFRMSM